MNSLSFKFRLAAFATGMFVLAFAPVARGAIVTFTDLTGNLNGGRVWAVTAGQQVGEAYRVNQAYAGLWSGNAASFIDLTPSSAFSALLNDTSGNQQVGTVWQMTSQPRPHAGLWTGSAGSFVDLHPTSAYASEAHATSGSQQVGVIWTGPTTTHAALWSGSATSFVDLNPPGSSVSFASAIAGNRQGGYAEVGGLTHAGLWSGTAASFVDLNPSGSANSWVFGMTGNQQVGVAFGHAGLWTGSASSFVDLNPAGAVGSTIVATTGDFQVGSVSFGGSAQAGLWAGTAGSFFNLHTSLGPDYFMSTATGIATNGNTIVIGGYGRKSTEFSDRPILWTITVPEPQSALLLLLGGSTLWKIRRKNRRIISS